MYLTILIYANCKNEKAKGDYTHAARVAKELQIELLKKHIPIRLILTNTLVGFKRFESLYESTAPGTLNIEGIEIAAKPLDFIDPTTTQVIAFIEANRCQYAPTTLLQKIISPQTKFLFLGAAHQPVLNSFSHFVHVEKYRLEQPGVYTYTQPDDINISPIGFGKGRYNLPIIATPIDECTPPEIIPDSPYGFAYANPACNRAFAYEIGQYFKLCELNRFVLIGQAGDYRQQLVSGTKAMTGKTVTFAPDYSSGISIIHHAAVNAKTMRYLTRNATTDIIMTTGVSSTLEAIAEKKLPYYQYSDHAEYFVASFLTALKQLMTADVTIPQPLFEFSQLLFKQKPLSLHDFKQLRSLSEVTVLRDRLIKCNQTILTKSQGKLAGQLLSFIGTTKKTATERQLGLALENLKKSGEQSTPTKTQALRRAAAWGRILELKIITDYCSFDEINDADTTHQHRTALHWAVIEENLSCIDYLLFKHAKTDTKDKSGKTPVDYAVYPVIRSKLINACQKGELIETGLGDSAAISSFAAYQSSPGASSSSSVSQGT